MSEDDIYLELGQILFGTAPESAVKVIVTAEVSPESDHCKLLFNYIDGSGVEDWFRPNSPHVDINLLKGLGALRKIYKENAMTGGHPMWSGCTITLDVVVGKLAIDFKYD
ncbi:antitoxin YezG family protein [Pseudomonas cucumis]|uniref:hypothetical protein n=1 Tax=Pseudomonas cucumis TaxID=2954082 RepID=UPI0027336DA6|nr:hypothetical protein [Pseudomonas cucumis]WLG89154.1 hypothetical protein PSH72_21750 [Pseudomonas cucumis]